MKRLLFLLMILGLKATAGELPVTIKGMDDGIKTNKQQDFKEAVMNAKLQAIEQSGGEISVITEVENFQMKYDLVESKSEGILLPGFQIMDIGYQTDGTYLVILSGKIKTAGAAGEDPSELYNKALLLLKQEKLEESLALLNAIITRYEGSEYAVRAYESKVEIEKNVLDYRQIAKKKIPENLTFNENKTFKLFDRTGRAHEVEVDLEYWWRSVGVSPLSLTGLDCKFKYSFAIFLDGKLIDKKTKEGRINKDGGPQLEVFDEATGLTVTVEQRKHWNVIEIWGGSRP